MSETGRRRVVVMVPASSVVNVVWLLNGGGALAAIGVLLGSVAFVMAVARPFVLGRTCSGDGDEPTRGHAGRDGHA